jgi:hypothetical protein
MNRDDVLRIAKESDKGQGMEGFILDFAARLEAEWMKWQEPVAETAAGKYGTRLMWATEEAQVNTPVGAKLYLHPTIPEGMVLVPKEPTEAMLLALKDGASDVEDEQDCKLTVFDYIRIEYKAMIAAAQGEKP